MNMIRLENQAAIFPMPAVIVGAMVDGKPNYMTASWVAPVNYKPVMVGVALGSEHYTTRGIQEEGMFGLSIPSRDHVRAVDYAGLVSGVDKDKSDLFEPFYGSLKRAPMVKDFPVTLECRVSQTVHLPMNTLFIAELAGIYAGDEYLTKGAIDVEKVSPFVFTMPDRKYWALGECIGDAWRSGKDYIL